MALKEDIIIVYEDIFNDEPKPLSEYLEGIGKNKLLLASQHFLSFKSENSEFADMHYFLSHFFRAENHDFGNEVYLKILNSQNRAKKPVTVINVLSSLKLFEYAYNNVSDITTQSDIDIEKNLFMGYLALSQEFLLTRSQVSGTSTQDLPIELRPSAFIFSLNFPYWDLDVSDLNKYFIAQICKAAMFFEYAEKELPVVLEAFLNFFECVNWKEYLKRLLTIPYILVMKDKEGTTDIHVIDNEEAEVSNRFLSKLILESEELMDKPDFASLRNRPLLKINDGQYRVIHSLFVVDKIYKGLYFKFREIHDKLGRPLGNLRQKITTSFSEQKLLYEIMDIAYGKRFKKLTGKAIAAMGIDGAPDYYVRNGRQIILFENKDILIEASIKESFDYSKYAPVIDEKLLKVGMTQLITNIRNILTETCPYDDSIPKTRKEIFPVLVLHDNMYNAPGLNGIINYHYYAELSKMKNEGLDVTGLRSMVIIDIDTLIFLTPLMRDRKIELLSLLSEYCDMLERSNQKFDSLAKANQANKEKLSLPFVGFLHKYNLPIDTSLFAQYVKAPRKIAVFENIESNNSINSGQNEKVKIHREPDREDPWRTRTGQIGCRHLS